jgi:5-methylcytosine-specific restriction endonuclease McrA
MILDSTFSTWIAVLVVVLVVVLLLMRRRRGVSTDHEDIIEQTRQVAQDAAREAAREAQDAAIKAYQQRERTLREEQAAKRKEAAGRARETKVKRIEALQPWRETFVLFVRRLAKPFFAEWELEDVMLQKWAEERADVYISKKPYVLEIIQSIHADAQRAAENYANQMQKSPREIARGRAKAALRGLERNRNCPYCGVKLDEAAHLDHIVPVQRGGPSEAWNMVFVCIPCNRAKRDLSLTDFVETSYATKKALKLSEIVGCLDDLDKFVEIDRAMDRN